MVEQSPTTKMLIDKYLPHYTYHEHHHTIVKAGAKDCFLTAKELDMSGSWITKMLMKLRGLPTNDLTLQGFLKNICFTYVEEEPYKEFLIDASQPGLKIFWNFYFKPITENETVVSTETRILCLNAQVKRRFSVYWFFIRPFSGLIRIEILRLIKKKLVFSRNLPSSIKQKLPAMVALINAYSKQSIFVSALPALVGQTRFLDSF